MFAGIPGMRTRKAWLILMFVAVAAASCRKPAPVYTVVAGKEGYTHTVTKGETLESIAERYYGDSGLGKALGEYNEVDPLEPLKPGNTLLVPFDREELGRIKSAQEAQLMYNRGTVLAKTGQYEDAAAYLEKAVAASPAHVDAWYNLALVYVKLGQTARARDILQRLADSFPSEKTYRYGLGAVLRESGDPRPALSEFEAALKLDPLYREAQYALALTYEDLGETTKARREWMRYLELDPDSSWSEEARLHLEELTSR
jgi:tetratricopeptide (TPR) repeat protein